MLPILQVGPLAVQTPLLLMLLGLWFSMSVGSRYAEKFNSESKLLDDLVLISILAGLLGGRIFYVISFPQAFLQNPAGIFSLNPELFLVSGGLLAGGIAFLIILQRRKKPLLQTLDALTLPMGIFAIFLGFSHFASGDVYGNPTSLPWAITLWGAERHPTQIYEILAQAAVLGFTWKKFQVMSHEQCLPSQSGKLFLYFTSLTALVWIILETFRADSLFIFGNLRTLQLIAFIVMIASFWLVRNLPGTEGSKSEEK